jgi:excisionase family DNA binding protein
MTGTLQSQKLAYSIQEAMHASSLGRTKVYDLIKEGKLQAVRIGGRTLIPAESLHALISGAKAIGEAN